jgi:hypothetical protein
MAPADVPSPGPRQEHVIIRQRGKLERRSNTHRCRGHHMKSLTGMVLVDSMVLLIVLP